jgi:hypothetical protein
MAQADCIHTTQRATYSRRAALVAGLGLVAATSVAAMALSVASVLPTVDPVHQLISNHVKAVRVADAANEDCALNTVEGFRTVEEQVPIGLAAYRALIVEIRAARALDGAATTAEALQALAEHRAIERHRRLDGWVAPDDDA